MLKSIISFILVAGIVVVCLSGFFSVIALFVNYWKSDDTICTIVYKKDEKDDDAENGGDTEDSDKKGEDKNRNS